MGGRRAYLTHMLVFAATDAVAVCCGLLFAYFLRFHAEIVPVVKGYAPAAYARILPLAIVVWLFWINQLGGYDFRARAFNLQIVKKLAKADLLAVMTLVTLHFFERTLEYSRLMYVLAMGTCFVSLSAARLALDRVLAHLRRRGVIRATRVAIVGTNALALELAQRIAQHAYLGFEVVGLIRGSDTASDAPSGGALLASPQGETGAFQLPILGNFQQARELIRRHAIEEIIVAEPSLDPQEVLEFILECEKELVTIRVVPNLLEAMLVEMSVEQIDGIPLFGLRETPLQGWNVVFKRAFDIVVSAVVLVLASPLMLLIALAVKLSSPGPVFYRQTRVGLDGQRFKIVKFRSMYQDAEEATGPVWATENDPRVTPVGRVLRRWNLDELPQFWNVLKGEMSLVGPRPERPHFVKQFRERVPRYMARHRVKCGMTGWAQIHGLRGNTSIDERLRYDLYYIENWSFWLDLKILFFTLFARKNAY
ncbi:MAG: undecaprenyl-phosphate glucose phosphotransferase [Candidatus Sumerlaea chitinivorans]|nr:undecaprenyl-phosphate glucose phosphotransferase [Candidatus Sumerlaea chitinivorans]